MLNPGLVVVVTEEPRVRKVLTDTLEGEGWVVLALDDGAELLDFVEFVSAHPTRRIPPRPVVAADRKVFLTPMEEGLRAAGTVEFGGLARAPNRKRADYLVRDMARVFPRAQIPADWSFWMGHRPCLPDSLPVMGPSRHRGLWFNFGHGHLGLTMSATSGDILARAICGAPSNIDLAPFSFARFGS